jgi:hypothetical protein
LDELAHLAATGEEPIGRVVGELCSEPKACLLEASNYRRCEWQCCMVRRTTHQVPSTDVFGTDLAEKGSCGGRTKPPVLAQPLESLPLDYRIDEILVDHGRFRGNPQYFAKCMNAICANYGDNALVEYNGRVHCRRVEYATNRGGVRRCDRQRVLPLQGDAPDFGAACLRVVVFTRFKRGRTSPLQIIARLLHHMSQLVCDQSSAETCVWGELAGPKYDMISDGVRISRHRSGRLRRFAIYVNPHPREVSLRIRCGGRAILDLLR